jgi:hypothetical protein
MSVHRSQDKSSANWPSMPPRTPPPRPDFPRRRCTQRRQRPGPGVVVGCFRLTRFCICRSGGFLLRDARAGTSRTKVKLCDGHFRANQRFDCAEFGRVLESISLMDPEAAFYAGVEHCNARSSAPPRGSDVKSEYYSTCSISVVPYRNNGPALIAAHTAVSVAESDDPAPMDFKPGRLIASSLAYNVSPHRPPVAVIVSWKMR